MLNTYFDNPVFTKDQVTSLGLQSVTLSYIEYNICFMLLKQSDASTNGYIFLQCTLEDSRQHICRLVLIYSGIFLDSRPFTRLPELTKLADQ